MDSFSFQKGSIFGLKLINEFVPLIITLNILKKKKRQGFEIRNYGILIMKYYLKYFKAYQSSIPWKPIKYIIKLLSLYCLVKKKAKKIRKKLKNFPGTFSKVRRKDKRALKLEKYIAHWKKQSTAIRLFVMGANEMHSQKRLKLMLFFFFFLRKNVLEKLPSFFSFFVINFFNVSN